MYLLTLFLSLVYSAPTASNDVADWLSMETTIGSGLAFKNLFGNIHPAGTSPGVVIASPSTKLNATDNNYFFFWVRDSALTMDVVNNYYKQDIKGYHFDFT